MEIKELRVGNLFNPTTDRQGIVLPETGIILEVVSLPFNHIECVKLGDIPAQVEEWIKVDYKNAEPIPITKERLLAVGFEKCKNGIQIELGVGYGFINSLFTGFPLTLEVDGNRMPLDIKYMHQLQNLYYDITGEELIKLEL